MASRVFGPLTRFLELRLAWLIPAGQFVYLSRQLWFIAQAWPPAAGVLWVVGLRLSNLALTCLASLLTVHRLLFRGEAIRGCQRPSHLLVPLITYLWFAWGVSYAMAWSRPASFALAREAAALLLQSLGLGLTAWALWSHRGTFAFLVEARGLNQSGPYRWLRHPVYLASMLVGLAQILRAPQEAMAVWLLGSWLLCSWRSRLEEEHLQSVFPEYADYRKRTFSGFL